MLREYGINWIKSAGVKKVEAGKIHYESLDGEFKEKEYDFSMLIPGFSGVGILAYDKNDQDFGGKILSGNFIGG